MEENPPPAEPLEVKKELEPEPEPEAEVVKGTDKIISGHNPTSKTTEKQRRFYHFFSKYRITNH